MFSPRRKGANAPRRDVVVQVPLTAGQARALAMLAGWARAFEAASWAGVWGVGARRAGEEMADAERRIRQALAARETKSD